MATGAWSPGVAFAVSGADLTSDDKVRLREIADSLRAHPSQRVIVEGYSDDVNADGQLTVARAGAQWEALTITELGEKVMATPALAGGRLYVRGDKHLFCFAPR